MNPRKHLGPLARFFEGVDAATIRNLVIGVAMVGGTAGFGEWRSGHKVAEVQEKVVEVQKTERRVRGGLLRMVDSLETRIGQLEEDTDDQNDQLLQLRAKVRMLERQRASRPRAQRLTTAQRAPEPEAPEAEAVDEPVAPGPPASDEMPHKGLLGWFSKGVRLVTRPLRDKNDRWR